MLRTLTCIALALSVASAFAAPAESRSRRAVRAYQAPVKDCTRLNGRWGYYGNPWCSPAEQHAFDRAEARRLTR
ncbi:MAG: hypothetical protein ABI457_12580 [Hyphomicrobium sp.]|jgi:hypothetical protein